MPILSATSPSAGVFQALFATLAIQVFVSFAGLAGPVLAPLAAADFGVDPIYVGLYVTAIYGVASVSSLASSGFIARFGPFRVSQTCLVLAAAGLVVAATGHPAALVATAVLLGLAYGPATPASSTLLAQGTPAKWMNLVFSVKQTGVPLGNMLAGAILPGVALAFGWRAATLLTAAACLLLAIVVQPLRAGMDMIKDQTRSFIGRGMLSGPLRLVFASPALRRMAIVSFAYSGMQISLSAFLVTYLNHDLGMPVVLAGIVLSAAQIAGVGGRVLWGVVADRLVRPDYVLGGLGLAMTAAAVMTGLFTPEWPLVAIFAVSIAFGGTAVAWNGVYLAQIARLSPPGRAGEVTAGTAFLTFNGVMIAPAVFSAIVSSTGSYTYGFATVAVVTFVSALSFFIAPRADAEP